MFKTYLRLLGFARPIEKYAIPYFFYSLLYALFNSLTFMLIIPILNTMFDEGFTPEPVETLPPLELNQEYLASLFNYAYSHLFDTYDRQNVLILLACVAICISLLSNFFRYMGAWTVESMRAKTLQRMRNEMFSKVMDMNVGYFSEQRKGDIISKITSDVGVVQFCITNTLQVAFREPFLIIGYIVMMIAISWELSVFSVLFPGGNAHLEMTDPEHPAETGIEVVAQPRGKRIAKMTLMSGGEKSLTALALLFAVYRTRTVPFYVLDEVEAALDDSNLSKLLDAIDVLRKQTQLLVVSHQRRTMEDADVLYGVSMQADGVSRVVSQRLDRATGKVVDA